MTGKLHFNRWLIVAISSALIVTFFLLREHWGHALGLAPYLILVACPLLHLLHPHGAHGADNRQNGKDAHH